jgi:hypothetical protein
MKVTLAQIEKILARLKAYQQLTLQNTGSGSYHVLIDNKRAAPHDGIAWSVIFLPDIQRNHHADRFIRAHLPRNAGAEGDKCNFVARCGKNQFTGLFGN